MMKLEVNHIQKEYGKKQVLKDISFQAEAGECIGILGSNGSGKSTLLTILAGICRPDRGEFLCDGTDLLKDKKRHRNLVGYVPQGTPLLEELTVWDNLLLWYQRKDLKRELSDGVLAMLGISEFAQVQVSRLSGGMKKRVSIGCAIAHRPEILLLDEACAALDLICKERILNYFSMYKAEGGCLILTTHDVQELELCSRCYILKDGICIPYQYDGNIHRLVGKL